jgi:hypothetical protein
VQAGQALGGFFKRSWACLKESEKDFDDLKALIEAGGQGAGTVAAA